jgi:hypothetical protein
VSAVAASFHGVAGTITGAALASGLSTVGTALYGHVLRRTHDRLRAAPPRWGRVAVRAVVVFALALSAVTLGKLVLGRSAAGVIHGTPRQSYPAIVQLEPVRGANAGTGILCGPAGTINEPGDIGFTDRGTHKRSAHAVCDGVAAPASTPTSQPAPSRFPTGG